MQSPGDVVVLKSALKVRKTLLVTLIDVQTLIGIKKLLFMSFVEDFNLKSFDLKNF